jgi:threonine dehydrogenase-like Zn-dependent dehydrogenase
LSARCELAVGILAAHCAFFRGAERVVLIDEVESRLSFAKARIPGLETLNFKEKKVNFHLS